MIRAAVWLAEQGFATIGWGDVRDGKGPVRAWKSDATDDPALVPQRLHGARNSLVIPRARGVIVDVDDPSVFGELEAAGLPPTFSVDSPTPGHGHVYGWASPDVDMSTIPSNIRGGEVRRFDPATRTASMVLGPWAARTDGIYTPRGGVRSIATLPASVIEYLVASARKQTAERSTAHGPDDAGWVIDKGRHDFLVTRGRNLRGVGVSGERLFDELVRIDKERCRPSLADTAGRGVDEIRGIVRWLEQNIADDPPDVRLILSAQTPPERAERVLPFRTAREVAQTAPETVPWAARPWLAFGATTEVVGKIKAAGKTTWLLALCKAVTAGQPFLGEGTESSAVVYLTEQPTISLNEALRRAGLLESDRLVVLQWADTGGASWPDVVAAAVAECKRRDARVLVVDTLSRFAGIRGDGENNAGEADAAMAPLQMAAAAGLAVAVARHERKSGGDVGESGRGSSAFGGAVDIVLALRRGEGNVRPSVRVIHGLSRFDETPDSLVIELTENGYVSLGDEQAVALAEARKSVVDILPKGPQSGMTLDEIVEKVKPRSTVQRALADLLLSGEVQRSGVGKRGDPYRHFLPAAIDEEFGQKPNGIDLTAAAQAIFAGDLEANA